MAIPFGTHGTMLVPGPESSRLEFPFPIKLLVRTCGAYRDCFPGQNGGQETVDPR
jgi:hypothetical protein